MRLFIFLATIISCSVFAQYTAIHNVQGYSLSQAGEVKQFQTLIIKDGKVVRTGGADLLKSYRRATKIDGAGLFLLPGFVVPQQDLIALGDSLLKANTHSAQVDIDDKFNTATRYLLSLGVTAVHDINTTQARVQYYQHRLVNKHLPLRIYGMYSPNDPHWFDLLKQGVYQEQTDMLTIRAVHVIAEEQSDTDLAAIYSQAFQHGFSAHTELTAVQAYQLPLRAYQTAFEQVGGKLLRNRVEFSIELNEVTIKVIEGHKLTPVKLLTKDLHTTTLFRLLAEQFAQLNLDNQNNRADILKTVTLTPAFTAHQEFKLGSLERGKWADFILVDQNIWQQDLVALSQAQVLQTWIAGERKY